MIEEKIPRLTPDQQREVEDFIDFLITKDTTPMQNSNSYDYGHSSTRDEMKPPAPMIFAEESPVAEHGDRDILPDYPEYGGSGFIEKRREPERRVVVPRRNEKEPGKLLDWID